MFPTEFQYFAPTSVAEAINLLQQHGDEAKILAGGHSLLPAMKLRLAQPGVLVDIGKITELKGVTVNGGVSIGAQHQQRDGLFSATRRGAHANGPNVDAERWTWRGARHHSRHDVGGDGDAESADDHAVDADDSPLRIREWTAGVPWRQPNVRHHIWRPPALRRRVHHAHRE